jgi:VWFA-related protein
MVMNSVWSATLLRIAACWLLWIGQISINTHQIYAQTSVAAKADSPAVDIDPNRAKAASDAEIRSDAGEIVLDMVVRDKKGRPIRDLKPEEIQVVDGQPVQIKSLRLVNESGALTATAAATTGAQELVANKQVKLITILMEPMTTETTRLARLAATAIVDKAWAQNNLFSVLEVRGRVRVLCPYTNDRAQLQKAIEVGASPVRQQADILATQATANLKMIAGGLTPGLLKGGIQSLGSIETTSNGPQAGVIAAELAPVRAAARLLLNIMESSMQQEREFRAIGVLNSLRAAITQLGKLPGRKSLIYFSIGLQIPTRFDPLFADTMRMANTNGVVIYTIDANGLDASERTTGSSNQLGRAIADLGGDMSNGSEGMAAMKGVDTALESMRNQNVTKLMEMAQDSGGIYLGDSNDVNKMATKVADDISTFYEISYAMPSLNYDGSFRPVTVTTTRKGAIIQARRGYFAIPPGQKSTISAYEVPLLKALEDKQAGETFSLQTRFVPIKPVSDKLTTMEVLLEIPLENLELKEDINAKVFRVRLASLLTFRKPDGSLVERVSRDLAFQAPLEKLDQTKAGKYSWHQAVDLAPGDYMAELAVMDRQSEKVSVQRKPIQVKVMSQTIALSEPILAKGMDNRQQIPDDEVLRMGSYVVNPAIASKLEVAGSETIVPFFVNVHREEPGKPFQLSAEITVDGIPAGKVQLPLPANYEQQKDVGYVANLPAKGLEPGNYAIKVVAAQEGDQAESQIELRIEDAPGFVRPPRPVSTSTSQTADDAVDAAPVVSLSSTTIEQLNGQTDLDAKEQDFVVRTVIDRNREWVQSLPNFFCIRTDRLLQDSRGSGKFQEVLQLEGVAAVVDRKERYVPVEKSRGYHQGSKPNVVTSNGEFGGLVRAIFDEDAKAKIRWKSFAMLNDERVHLLEYSVERPTSKFKLHWPQTGEVDFPAYRGFVFLEEDSLRLVRLTLETVGVREKFPLQQVTHEVDYSMIKLSGVEFLLPHKAIMQTRVGKRRLSRSEITFRDYAKWGSESKIVFDEP